MGWPKAFRGDTDHDSVSWDSQIATWRPRQGRVHRAPDTLAEARRDKRPVSCTVTIVVLSAGGSPFLHRVLCAILGNRPAPGAVRLIWSGHGPVPPAVPAAVQTTAIQPTDFDHGGTRQLALELCTTELLAFLSDDAEPVGNAWLKTLIAPFTDTGMAAVYGRQIPRPDAHVAERVFRASRYPAGSRLITPESVATESEIALPISNANGAYRVAALRSLGGFPRPCSYGEDLAVALAALNQGWRVRYVAEAEVWHSHHLSGADLFRRGRRAGWLALDAKQRGVTTGLRGSASGGSRLVWKMIRTGWREYGFNGAVAVLWASAVRALGYLSARIGWR